MARPKKEKPNRPGGMYEVKVTVGRNFDGSPIRKSFYSKVSKEAAKAKAEKYKIEQAVYDATGEPPSSHDMPFDAWAWKVLEALKGTMKDSSFEYHYRIPVRDYLIPYFQKRRMQDIRQIDIQNYFNKQKSALALDTLKCHRMVLHRIFASAAQNGIIAKNPCEDIRIISDKKPKEKRTYTEEQCALVLDYAKIHRFGLDITLMLEYGITRSELLGLQWCDIDFTNCILHICRGIASVRDQETLKMHTTVGETKNRFRDRYIPLTKETTSRLLADYADKKCDFVVCTHDGRMQNPRNWERRRYKVFMHDMHKHYLEKGIDIPELTAHELRHTRATLWVNSGANLFAVADVLGHSDLKMLRKRYAHSDVDATRKMLGIDEE